MAPRLSLHEELLLLALRDEEGTIEFGVDYAKALGGAALAELLLDERVRLEGSKKNPKVRFVRDPPPGDDFLEACCARVRDREKPRTAQDWVSRFGQTKDLKHRVAQGLCDKGILRAGHDRVLGIFPRRIYPEADGRVEEAIVERLRTAIFTDAEVVERRTTVLISLASATGLLKPLFGRKELKRRRESIERIVRGERVGQATRQAIEAAQAAMLVAVYVPVIVSS